MTFAPSIAKITRPKASRLTERPRLFAALDEARQVSATWVSAPPGFGKTSLASSYVEQRGFDCLWYRVDEEDADVGNFFYYLNQAGKSLPRHDGDLPSFTPENLPSLGAFARRFFESLYLRLRPAATLVFDDYQELAAESPLHLVLAKAVEHLPEGINILFLSREQPPAGFARLRTHGAVAHIDAEALRLTQGEAQAFAARKGSPGSGQDEINRLNEIAGGWTAGLMLLLERGNLSLPESMPGTATLQVLFDYFSQEIFRNLDPPVQALLLKCALLPEMPVEAVEQVAGTVDASHLLDKLSTRNYFTTRHDGAITVYRFHPLFRAFLLEQAEKTIPRDQIAALRQRAAHALAQGGHTEEVVALLHACGDWQALIQTILTHAEQLSRQGRLQTLESWIRQVPEPLIDETPWLLFWLGSCQLLFDPLKAKATLLRAYALFEAAQEPAGLYLCWSGIATVYYFAFLPAGEALVWISTFEALQRRHPDFPSPAIEARVALGLVSLLRLYRLDHSQLPHWLTRCRSLLNTIEGHTTRLLAGGDLAWCYSWLGKTAEWAALLRELAPLSTADTPPLARLNWLTTSAMYAWHRADTAACAAAVAQALRLADESDVHLLDHYLCVFGVYGALSVGDAAAAQALQSRFEGSVSTLRTADVASFHHVHTLLNIHQGNFRDAEQHARQALAQSEQLGIVFVRFIGHACLAAILAELGHMDEAAKHFEHAARLAKGVDSGPMTHLSLLGKALLEFKRGRQAEALELLRGAIESAKAIGGHYTPFYHRETLAALYALGLEANLEVSHLQAQIRLQCLVPQTPESVPENWPWPVKVYTLGRFSLVVDGEPVNFAHKAQKKPLALLQVLIALGGRDIDELPLAEALASDGNGETLATLSMTLLRLRKLLGHPDAVTFSRGKFSLDPSVCWVDAWAFERGMAGLGEPDPCPQALQKALLLYRGPLLAREPGQPWMLAPRARLHGKYLRGLRQQGDRLEGERDWEAAAHWYQCGIEHDPASEDLYRRLMRCHQARGEPADAIQVYQRCRSMLSMLLGVSPSAETEALRKRLVEQAAPDAESALD